MSLLIVKNICLAYGGPPVLEGVDLQVDKGERLCLLGRNGSGKSSLMKVLAGEIEADSGEIIRRCASVSRLGQEVPAGLDASVYDVIAGGLAELGQWLIQYHHLSGDMGGDERQLAQLARVQKHLEAADGWNIQRQVDTVISRLSLQGDVPFASLSGGLKRRVMLARALVGQPDFLMLDEPTNHLDVAAIEWLELFLLKFQGALMFVTHDRSLSRKLATRIVELDRGHLLSWPGDYDRFMEKKQEYMQAERKQQDKADKKLSHEEDWLRQGVKARRKRNQGRLAALQAMRQQRRERREVGGQIKLSGQDVSLSGKLVIEARELQFAFDDKTVLRDFSTLIMRGDRVGIVGPNGCGKTTLIKLLLARLEPGGGKVRLGTNLDVAYYDQYRQELIEEKSVRDNVCPGSDFVEVNGSRRHVIAYLKDFLFEPDRIDTPVSVLSGGERNRVMLARLFTKPCNLLVLDEPTNDLDMDTLELLEEMLAGFKGTIILVSHDRAFLDNVVTSTIVFEADGVHEYVGGYQDYLEQSAARKPLSAFTEEKAKPGVKEAGQNTSGRPGKSSGEKNTVTAKLSYKEKRELETLPGQIEQWETEQQALTEQMADPAFYRQDGERIAAVKEQLTRLQSQLSEAYARWEDLEGRQS